MYVQKDRAEGRRHGEPWVATLQCAKPIRGIDKPWRLIVHRGFGGEAWDRTAPHRLQRVHDNKPAVFAEYADEATARSAFAAAVRHEKNREP